MNELLMRKEKKKVSYPLVGNVELSVCWALFHAFWGNRDLAVEWKKAKYTRETADSLEEFLTLIHSAAKPPNPKNRHVPRSRSASADERNRPRA